MTHTLMLHSSLRIWSPLLRDLESKVLVKLIHYCQRYSYFWMAYCVHLLFQNVFAPPPTPKNGIRVQDKLIGGICSFLLGILAGTISKSVVPCRLAVCHARKSRWNKSTHGNKATEYTVVVIVNFMFLSHSIKQACVFCCH